MPLLCGRGPLPPELCQSTAGPTGSRCRLTPGQLGRAQLAQRPLAWRRQNVRLQQGWADAASEGRAAPSPPKRPAPQPPSIAGVGGKPGRQRWLELPRQTATASRGNTDFLPERTRSRAGGKLGLIPTCSRWSSLPCLGREDWPRAGVHHQVHLWPQQRAWGGWEGTRRLRRSSGKAEGREQPRCSWEQQWPPFLKVHVLWSNLASRARHFHSRGPQTALAGRYCACPHFSNEETEAHVGRRLVSELRPLNLAIQWYRPDTNSDHQPPLWTSSVLTTGLPPPLPLQIPTIVQGPALDCLLHVALLNSLRLPQAHPV